MDEYILKKLNEIVISLGEITSYGTGLLAARENADCNSYPSDEIFDFNDCKGPTLEDVDDWWKEYTKQMNIEKEDVANHKEIEQNMMPQYKDGSFRPKNMNTGLLEYRYKDIDNKIISVYGLSKQECWNKRTKRLRETSELSSPDKLTLTVWLNEWYKTYKVPYNGEASLKEINRYIKQIANYFGDKISISDITTLQCQQFINKYSNKPNTQNKYFAELYDKLGIKNATIHSFRHTFVSTLYALGVSAKRIQTLAGHATIDMTLNTYTHLLDKGNSVIREYLQQLSLLF